MAEKEGEKIKHDQPFLRHTRRVHLTPFQYQME